MFYSARIIEGQNRFAVGNQMMCVGRMQVVVVKWCVKTVLNSEWQTTRRSRNPTGQMPPEKSVSRS